MLIRLFSAAGDGDYRKVLKRRCILFGALLALGLATVATAVVLGILQIATNDFVRGFYSGVGGGVAGGCGVALIGTLRLMKNEEKMRREQIKELDERSKSVNLRAMSSTSLLLIVIAYVALMISVVVNLTVFFTLMAVLLVFFACYLSAYTYYNKKL